MAQVKNTHNDDPFFVSTVGVWLRGGDRNVADWVSFAGWIGQLADEKGFSSSVLGQVNDYPILLLTPTQPMHGPNLLVAAGFHGDEPAGCWGVVRFLEELTPHWLTGVNLSILPLVNVTGFVAGTRRNRWGEDPNRGYCHTVTGQPEPSREGKILLRNLPQLKLLAKDGFLSLHEDIEMEQFYIYTFEDANVPGPFSEALRAAESEFFEACPDGVVEGALLSRGVAFRFCDGSFEDLMFHEGTPRTAATETPGLLDLHRRVEANKHTLEAFVNYSRTN